MTRDYFHFLFRFFAGLIVIATTTLVSSPDQAKTPKAVPAMLVHYRFEDGGARPVKDDSGNNREGTLGGEPAVPESAYPALGKATRLDTDRWIRVSDLGSQDAITIEMWVKLARPETDIAGLYAADTWKTGSVHLNLRAGGGVEFAINGVGRFPISEPDTLPVGKWVHLAAAYDRKTGEMSLYANGKRVLRADAEPRPQIKLSPAAIGAWQLNVPEATDLSKEPKKLLEEYGADDAQNKLKAGFARNCILARRLLERGVRFVQLFNGAYAMGEGVGN